MAGKREVDSLFSRKINPLAEIIREFTNDKQKGEAKLKEMAAQPKEKSRTHPAPRSGPESWGHSRTCRPSEVLVGKGSCCSFCDRQICQLLWHKTQLTFAGVHLSCCSTFAQERHYRWPDGEYIWPLQNDSLEKKTPKNVTHAPSHHLLQAGARMSI